MNKTFVNTIFVLLLVALIILAVTGLMFVFKVGNYTAGEIHMITGLVFVGLVIIHIITFGKMMCNFMCTRTAKNK